MLLTRKMLLEVDENKKTLERTRDRKQGIISTPFRKTVEECELGGMRTCLLPLKEKNKQINIK